MKVLIIGYGSIAGKHHWALNQIDDDLQLFALRSSEKSNKIEGVKSIFNFSEIPDNLDFIIISNPTAKHAEYIEKIISLRQSKTPLFIEKPVFHTVNNENESLVREIKVTGIKTYVACNLRYHPLLIKFKEIIDPLSSSINEVNVYCGSYLPDWRKSNPLKKSYSTERKLGGGVDLDLIHEIDYISWFFGMADNVIAVKTSDSHLNINSIDAAYYILKYKGFVANIALNYFRRKPKRTFEVVCSDHTYQLDLIQNKIFKDDEVIVKGEPDDIMTSYRNQMTHFVEVVKTNATFDNDIENAYRILQICLIDEIKR